MPVAKDMSNGAVALGAAPVGFAGRIHTICVVAKDHGLSAAELERRLIELGFVEGARVEVLHQGLFGRDPIAVRVNEATVALRRREAAAHPGRARSLMSEIASPTRVALVGNPNSGKTALFNALTGSRQKVANYPGVTVERKEGLVVTPAGLTVRLIDLPGTYSLRARSLDEIVTRDIVLGRLESEATPSLLVCVADSTNLRLALRLALELKRVGRPMILALNMFDIARHRGFEIDLDRLSAELGIPVVASVAVRRGGTNDLLARIDEVISERGLPRAQDWSEPNAAQLRATQREADRILDAAVKAPGRPDGFTRRLDRVVLHPVLGLVILLAILFLMFQAVFTWAQAPMDLIKSGFDGLAAWAGEVLPQGWLLSFVRDGVISGVGSVLVFLPQILTLFFFILLLEDFGYMARAAFLMDRIMGGAGLHGRAFIPLLSSFACAIPGIMATRVIASRRGRLVTILVAPLMTCSARIPVYTLIIAAFIPARTVLGWFSLQGLVMFGLYAAGIAGALGMSWVFNRFCGGAIRATRSCSNCRTTNGRS